jgi:hypothetical protein
MKKIIALALVAISSGSVLFAPSTKRHVPASSQNASSPTISTGIKAKKFDAIAEATYVEAGSESTWDLHNMEALLIRCQQAEKDLESFDSKDADLLKELKDAVKSVQLQVTTSKRSDYKHRYVNGTEGCVERLIKANNAAISFMRPNVLTTTWFSRHKVAFGAVATAIALASLTYYNRGSISKAWNDKK